MVVSKNLSERGFEDLISNLEYLIKNARDDGSDLVAIRTQLTILIENVKDLAESMPIVKIQVALLEKSVEQLEEWRKNSDQQVIQENSDHYKSLDKENSSLKIANKSGVWQIRAAILTGILSLIATIASHFIGK